jgi:hypothetical protein
MKGALCAPFFLEPVSPYRLTDLGSPQEITCLDHAGFSFVFKA